MMPKSIELLNANIRRGPFRAAMFDFDGTLSLIREGWAGIMAEIGLNLLRDKIAPPETERSMRALLEVEMLRLSGKPSIMQMQRLAQLATERGAHSPAAEELHAIFHTALEAITSDRKRRIINRIDVPEAWAVPGAHALLNALLVRNTELYLASGTELHHVRHEAELLQLIDYFPKRLFAPETTGSAFNKRDVVQLILREQNMTGEELIGFGDGYAETVEVKRAGGVAVGLATSAIGESSPNAMKRAMLADLGADIIISDYAEADALVRWLWNEA